MRGGVVLVVVALLAFAAIGQHSTWHPRPALVHVVTHVPGAVRVADCQHLSAHWNPSYSTLTLRRWMRCMELYR